MKVFISQPMNGRTEAQIREERSILEDRFKLSGDEVLDTIFEIKTDNPIIYLAKSIEQLAIADQVIFMKDWEKARGCRIEYEIAKNYGKEILMLGE